MLRSGSGTRRLPVVAALAFMSLTLLACGSDDGNSSGQQPDREAFAKFQACLEEQGVNLPQGGPGGGAPPDGRPPANGERPANPPNGRPPGGADGKKLRAAMQACRKYLPEGGGPGGEGGFPGRPPDETTSGGSS